MWELLLIPWIAFCTRASGGGFRFDGTTVVDFRVKFWKIDFDVFHIIKWYSVMRKVCQASVGFLLAWLISDHWWVWCLASPLWMLGDQWSWHKSINFGVLFDELSGVSIEEEWLKLRFFLRGIQWALLTQLILPIQYWLGIEIEWNLLLLLLMGPAFQLSAYWGYRMQTWFDKHAFAETSRGTIIAALIVLATTN